MIRYFVGNTTTNTLKVLEESEDAGVFSYQFHSKDIRNRDIRQILRTTWMILGTYEGVTIRHEPFNEDTAIIFLCIKNRSDIELGTYRYSKQ